MGTVGTIIKDTWTKSGGIVGVGEGGKKKKKEKKSSRVSVQQGEEAGDAEGPSKSQNTKFHLQTLTLDSSRGRVEWTRDT